MEIPKDNAALLRAVLRSLSSPFSWKAQEPDGRLWSGGTLDEGPAPLDGPWTKVADDGTVVIIDKDGKKLAEFRLSIAPA